MTAPADSELLAWDESSGRGTLTVRGDWTLDNYVTLGEQIARLQAERGNGTAGQGNVDLTGLAALDTSGASRLYELLGGELVGKISTPGSGLSAERSELLQTVAKAMETAGRPTRKRTRGALIELFGRAGLAMEGFWGK